MRKRTLGTIAFSVMGMSAVTVHAASPDLIVAASHNVEALLTTWWREILMLSLPIIGIAWRRRTISKAR